MTATISPRRGSARRTPCIAILPKVTEAASFKSQSLWNLHHQLARDQDDFGMIGEPKSGAGYSFARLELGYPFAYLNYNSGTRIAYRSGLP